jgi:hypothetical protein
MRGSDVEQRRHGVQALRELVVRAVPLAELEQRLGVAARDRGVRT